MKPSELCCWKCGAVLEDILLPLSRTAKCKSCHVDLHVCRMCCFYDPSVSNSCSEPLAEKVTDKQRRNFCGYLQPDPSAYRSADTGKVESARHQLDALFGIESGSGAPGSRPEEESSRQRLEDLFDIKKDD